MSEVPFLQTLPSFITNFPFGASLCAVQDLHGSWEEYNELYSQLEDTKDQVGRCAFCTWTDNTIRKGTLLGVSAGVPYGVPSLHGCVQGRQCEGPSMLTHGLHLEACKQGSNTSYKESEKSTGVRH